MKITNEDRDRFPHHTDSAILGIKVIERLSDEHLFQISEGDGIKLQGLKLLIGEDKNPRWILARVAEQLYDRDLIDEQRFDRLTENL